MRGGAFQRAGANLGTVEGELALNTLSEVADNIPLYILWDADLHRIILRYGIHGTEHLNRP